MPRFHITMLLMLAAMVFSTFAPTLSAQSAEARNDAFTRNRHFMLAQPRADQDEEFYLSGRLYIESIQYDESQFIVTVYVGWVDGTNKLIPGISVNVSVWSMPGWVSAAGNRGLAERIDDIRADPKYAAEALTNKEGLARVRMEYPRGSKFAGLQPGEYTIKAELDVGSQTPAVQDKMIQDPQLFGVYTDESGNLARPRTPDEKRARWPRLTQKKVPVPAAFNKLYVLEEGSWVDDGTLAAEQEIRLRRSEWQTALKNRENKELLGASDAEIESAKDWENATLAWFEQGGGEMSSSENAAFKRAQKNSYETKLELLEWEDRFFEQYLGIIEGDFKYWNWKAVTLYGTTVYNICNGNELPWNSASELAKARGIMGPKFEMKDVKDWRKFMKRWTEVLTEGDKDTWKENWKDGSPPAGHPAGLSEWRGGSFPARLLKQMKADIDAFDPEKLVTPAKRTVGEGDAAKVIDTYIPNDIAMGAFEENFAIAMGIDPDLTQSNNGRTNGFGDTGRDVQSLRFEVFEFQKDLKQRISVYDPQSASEELEMLSTGDRVRALDLGPLYGYDFTRFAKAAGHLQAAFETLSHMPTAYRYTIYRYTMRLSVNETLEHFGPQTPTTARVAANTISTKTSGELDEAKKVLSYVFHPFFGLYVYGAEGPYRNFPEDMKMEHRGGRSRSGQTAQFVKKRDSRVKDPTAVPEAGKTGPSDIIVDGDDNPEGDATGQ